MLSIRSTNGDRAAIGELRSNLRTTRDGAAIHGCVGPDVRLFWSEAPFLFRWTA